MEKFKVSVSAGDTKVKDTYRSTLPSAIARALAKVKKLNGDFEFELIGYQHETDSWKEIHREKIEKGKLDEAIEAKKAATGTTGTKTDSDLKVSNNRVTEAFAAGKITKNEAKVLDFLINVLNYGEWSYSWVTVEDIATGVGYAVKSSKGFVGSLTKKGYVYPYDWGSNADVRHTVHLHKEGWKLCDKFSDEDDRDYK